MHKPGKCFEIRVTYDGSGGLHAFHLKVDGRPARPFSMMHIFGDANNSIALFQGFMDEFGKERRFKTQAVPSKEMTDEEIARMRRCEAVNVRTYWTRLDLRTLGPE